jgi:AraC-like DNA-binding protein
MYRVDNLHLKKVVVSKKTLWRGCEVGRFCFLFIQSGSGRLELGENHQELHQGGLLFLHDGTSCVVAPSSGSALHMRHFSVFLQDLALLSDMGEIALLRNFVSAPRTRYYPQDSPVSKKCHDLLEVAPLNPGLEQKAHLLRIATVVVTEFIQASSFTHALPAKARHFFDVLKRLSFEDVLHLSNEQIARKYGYSHRHLNRLLHQYLGITSLDLKTEVRLLKASALLKDLDKKISDVAQETGFHNIAHFGRSFKKRFGCKPDVWRRQIIELQEQKLFDGLPKSCQLQSAGMCFWTRLRSYAHGSKPPLRSRID